MLLEQLLNKVYNLCIEEAYDPLHFHGRVETFPFDDNHVPPLRMIKNFCESVDSWLSSDPKNIAVVHCMAGKGRTGLMVSAYLVYSGISAEEALQVYAHKQTTNNEGVIYRIKLPGPAILGEGKPENQNHAIIFTRGEGLQTIDMNQDNYMEEAFKMRNLLQEFLTKQGVKNPTILGLREHIFTGSVSSLAWFMSILENSFVTIGQRLLANPLKFLVSGIVHPWKSLRVAAEKLKKANSYCTF